MNRYEFLVPNNKIERLIVTANSEEEAKQKLFDFDLDEEETEQDDYDFDLAELDIMEEDV